MKKVLALTLAAIMMLSLCACGGLSEEEARAIELYNKYENVIERLEDEDYNGVIQEIVGLANSGKEQEEKTPMAELMADDWYLGNGEQKMDPAKEISINADGTVKIGGETFSTLEKYNGDDNISCYLLKDGVHTYIIDVNKYRDDLVPYLQMYTVVQDGDNFYSDDWVGTYYNEPLLGYLLRSWNNLDQNDAGMDDYFSVQRSYCNINDGELDWSVTSSDEKTLTVDLAGEYTFTVELRGEKAIGFLTENATGDQAAYYASGYEGYGYDCSWPEFIYPRAVRALNECLEDLAEERTPGFYDYTVEEGVSYSNNAAWKRLYEMFTGLGSYKDSAELAARFTILKDMYTGASSLRVDNLGNESTNNTYETCKYNAAGQVVESRVSDNKRLYGNNYKLYFFYDAAGRISKIQEGTGNSVSVVITPSYDNAGRMVSAISQSNSATNEFSYDYDAQGRLTQNTAWNGSNRYQHTYTYDADGNMIKDVCWQGWGDPVKNYYRYTTDYTYDAQGNLIEKREVWEDNYGSGYSLRQTTVWTYTNDAQGRPVTISISETNGSGESSYQSLTVTCNYEDLYFFE